MTATVITLDYPWFQSLRPNQKGAIGETVAECYVKSILRTHPDRLFPVNDIEQLRLHIMTHYDVPVYVHEADEDGEIESEQWDVDRKLVVWPRGHYERQKTVLMEVKTGEYAELERRQEPVMKRLARNPANIVVKCNVTFDAESMTLAFSELTPTAKDVDWRPSTRFQ